MSLYLKILRSKVREILGSFGSALGAQVSTEPNPKSCEEKAFISKVLS